LQETPSEIEAGLVSLIAKVSRCYYKIGFWDSALLEQSLEYNGWG
jgi:hypothetical protein